MGAFFAPLAVKLGAKFYFLGAILPSCISDAGLIYPLLLLCEVFSSNYYVERYLHFRLTLQSPTRQF